MLFVPEPACLSYSLLLAPKLFTTRRVSTENTVVRLLLCINEAHMLCDFFCYARLLWQSMPATVINNVRYNTCKASWSNELVLDTAVADRSGGIRAANIDNYRPPAPLSLAS